MIGTEFIKGQGLGNQMLCYVTARCAALDHGCEFGTVNSDLLGNVVHSQKGMYFMEIDPGIRITEEMKASMTVFHEAETRIYPGNSEHDLTHGCYISGADPDLLKVSDNTLIQGNMQSEEYFLKHRDEICKWLKLTPEFDSDRYTADDLCIINIRGGEYTCAPELYLDRRYFLNAIKNMKKIVPAMRFMVVTEDEEAARKVLPEYECHHFDMGRDYATIHNARYLIMSNSSFAVLPAFTSSTLRFVIAPKYWARHNVSDGYWASEQNIYSFAHYQDRSGKLFTAGECRQELQEYKKTSQRLRNQAQPPCGISLFLAKCSVKRLKTVFMARKILRKVQRTVRHQ